MAHHSNSHPDPYRVFFPLGILLALIGVSIWPLVNWGVVPAYWGASHSWIQAGGFLLAFIVGFLLTALPRFTGTENPGLPSQLVIAVLIVASPILLDAGLFVLSQAALALAYVVFVSLCFVRVRNRDRKPPETFGLIGFGLLTGLFGVLASVSSALGVLPPMWALAGKRALTEGMTLLLVLGVGGFLGPGLLGYSKLSLVQIGGLGDQTASRITRRARYILAGAIILLSIFLEYVAAVPGMDLLRAIVSSIVIGVTLQPWKLPASRTTLSWCMWYSIWLTVIGLWLVVLLPAYRVEMMHVMFIGGFTLMILAVGMRVTLSHGGHGLEPERKNWPLRIGLMLGSIAMLSRVGAAFSPESYTPHLAYASLCLVIALLIWGMRIVRLIYRRA